MLGLVHLPGIDRKTPAVRGHVIDVVIKLTRHVVDGRLPGRRAAGCRPRAPPCWPPSATPCPRSSWAPCRTRCPPTCPARAPRDAPA
eukprot:1349585-Pyramimonas_sp.AAC.1